MQLFSLFLVAFGAAFAIVWLLLYVPLNARIPFTKKTWSPRLAVCKLLGPFDAGITMILVAGGWLGITSAVGLGVTVFNVLSGIGLSMGVLFTQKVLIPKWKKEIENGK